MLAILTACTSQLATGADREDPRAFRAWQNRWTSFLQHMAKVEPEKHLAYGRKRSPDDRYVVTLETPVPTHHAETGQIEVEWFHTYLSDSHNPGRPAAILDFWNRTWLKELRASGVETVRFVRTPVSHIAGLEGGWGEHRERHLEVILAQGDPNDSAGRQVHRALLAYLSDGNKALALHTREDAERFFETTRFAGIQGVQPAERYRAAAGTPELAERMRRNNERLAQVLDEASRTHPNTTLSPHDPIFLVAGKYLVTGSNTGRVARAYQTVNGLIHAALATTWTTADARRAKRRISESKGLDREQIAFHQTRHAKLRRAITLDPPLTTPGDGVTVELFFSYDTELHKQMYGAVTKWSWSLPKEVTFVRSPIRVPAASNPTIAKRHQEIMMAGRPVIWEDTLQVTMYRRGLRRVTSEADLDELLAEIKMPRQDYDQGLADPETQARIRDVNARYAHIEAAATDKRNPDMRHAPPIVLINGRHLIVGHRFRRVRDALHTASALVAAELTPK